MQRQPPVLVPPARVRAPRHPWPVSHSPGREVVLVQFSSRAELREIIRRQSPRRPHVCSTCVRASRTTRPCPPHGRGDYLKNKKEEEKNDEMRTRNRDGGKFAAGAPMRLVVIVVVIDDDDIFLVNNENFCRLAEGTPALRRSSYNMSFFLFPSQVC